MSDARLVGSILIVAALLVGGAGLFHPVLSGDATTQLASIAATPGWRIIHWSLGFGHVLAVAAMAGLSIQAASTAGRSAARLGLSLMIFGYGASLVGVLFMLGPAHSLAAASHANAADAAWLYETLHPFARGALRIGAFAISIGLGCFGWSMKQAGRLVLGWFATGAGVVGAVVAVALSEHAPAIVTGIGLAAVWQLVVGIALWTRRHPRPGA